jgi:DNA-binding MarR family transcriptional regulator/GNAT superfamily N-acetyltransferase
MKSNIPIDPQLESQIAAIRGFSRFYTRKLGIIEPKLLDSPWTLQEARIIYEIAKRQSCTATELVHALGLDAGFLSRTLQAMQRRQVVARKPSKADRRVTELALTAKGRAAFAELDSRSRSVVAALLGQMDTAERAAIVKAMAVIEHTLEPPAEKPRGFLLREPRPGDMGWVVQSHGARYASEYGFDSSFEGLVAEIAAKFLASFDASRERCWIADIDGAQVGSVFLVRHSDDVAKLRLLLVDPAGRGQGLGKRLVGECISFAQACGYRKITLWTQSILLAARKIYQDAGFELVATEPHRSFGQCLIGETWEKEL